MRLRNYYRMYRAARLLSSGGYSALEVDSTKRICPECGDPWICSHCGGEMVHHDIFGMAWCPEAYWGVPSVDTPEENIG